MWFKIFNYEGSDVYFNIGEGVMVNATKMASMFGKRVSKWLDQSTERQEMAKIICERKSLSINVNEISLMGDVYGSDLNFSILSSIYPDMITIIYGGNPNVPQGTWLHEDLAIEFARWLSPEFAMWCNDRIKEL